MKQQYCMKEFDHLRLENQDLKKTLTINKHLLSQVLGPEHDSIQRYISNNLWETERHLAQMREERDKAEAELLIKD